MIDLLEFFLDGVAGASSFTIRVVAYYFTRWLPLGPRFIPIIYGAFSLYITTVATKYLFVQRRKGSKPSSSIPPFLSGSYDSHHRTAFFINVLLNICALVATVDFVYRPRLLDLGARVSFSRTGYVDSHTAKIVVRAPDSTAVQLLYRKQHDNVWIPGPVEVISDSSDYTATFRLLDLSPGTQYSYKTNASHSGSLHTTEIHPKTWTMLSSSCIKPGFPYNPLGNPLRVPGLEHVSNFIRARSTEFMLFLGDFIYIDLPHPLGQHNNDYRSAYRQVYASPSWTYNLYNLPFLHTYDDHEFENDWAGNTTGIFSDAVEPFHNYQGRANPEPLSPDKSYYTFTRGDVDFFVLDARKYRSSKVIPDGPAKTMLGKEQLDDLISWLQTGLALKVVVSSVPFTRNWRGPEAFDNWAGFLHEREKILSAMWKTQGVIIISGDRHEHATTEFPAPDGTTKVIEFSTSPLSQFYQPFERMYRQVEDGDVEVYYHPWGVSKFGAFTFDTSRETEWTVLFELIVDGKREWSKNVSFSRGL